MDIEFMRQAIAEAKRALDNKDVPVGAVVVRDGVVVASAYNRREADRDATAHAEVLAIREACRRLGRWNLSDCDLYVTLEPCVMCAGAIVYARIRHVYFGAHDLRFGCAGTVYNLAADEKFNHRAAVTGGILEDECKTLLTDFFRALRDKRTP